MNGIELNWKDGEALAGHSWGYLTEVVFKQRSAGAQGLRQEEPWRPIRVNGGECGARGDEAGARTRSYRYCDPMNSLSLTLKTARLWVTI